MNKEQERFHKIYDLLVSIGGASESDRFSFVYNHTEAKYPCSEWRFCGQLGFGGKYRSDRNTVDCYSEDETPERLAIIGKLNEALKSI